MTQQQPVRIEARVSAQERRQINTDARIEELAEDMTASFKQQTAYQVGIEQKIDALQEDMDARFTQVDTRIDALKADMVAMEGRILDAFQQLVAVIETRLPGQIKGE